MEDNRNIDQLFRERLGDFEKKPNPELWSQIEGRLDNNKKRPFAYWWLYSGVAVVIIGFLLVPTLFENPKKPIQKIEQNITTAPTEDKLKQKDTITVFEKQPNVVNEAKENTRIAIQKKPIQKIEKPELNIHEKEEQNLRTPSSRIALSSILIQKSNSLSYEDAIVETPLQKKKEKSLVNLFDVVNDKDSLTDPTENTKKWAIQPTYAFTSSQSFNDASPIDRLLQSNPKSGSNASAFGISLTYKIGKKWAIRSGIHTHQAKFSTRNVNVVSGVTSSGLTGVTNTNNSLLVSDQLFVADSTTVSTLLNLNTSTMLVSNNAVIEHQYNYIEVPVEFRYDIFNKTEYSLGVISGISALFLNKNMIQLLLTDSSYLLGESNNLNSLNFSSNLGIDFNYAILENVYLNVNPMFKLHLNTFSRDSNGFRPYFWGVYSGIKYQF